MIKFFGTTLSETKTALEGRIHLGGKQVTKEDKTKAIGRIIISCLLALIATYLITSGKSEGTGTTIMGALVGYWIK